MSEIKEQIIESKPLREQVADIVRGMILRGEIKAGEQISERTIGQMLHVSTTPVKEAFRSLQAEVLSIPGRDAAHSYPRYQLIICWKLLS